MQRLEDRLDFDGLVRVLSHDLRAPARAIGQYLLLIRSLPDLELPERATHYLNRIEQVAERMDTLLDTTLVLSRGGAEAGAQEVGTCSAPFEVAATAANAVGVPLTVVGACPALAIAEPALTRLLTALLKNIHDHAGPDANATLHWNEALVLRDQGPGIDPRYHDELFLPFRPVQPADSPHRGLGLALVSRICRAVGGSVVIELPDDGGVQVRVSLPPASEAPVADAP